MMEFRRDTSKGYSLFPITALEFCCVSGEEVLLEGEGPILKVFSKEGSLLCEEQVLPFNCIHGIQLGSSSVNHDASSNSNQFLVFGQKSFRLVEITKEDDHFKLCCLSDVLHMFDWILAATLLSYSSDSKNFKVALVTAHNALILFDVDSDGTNCSTYQCEVNCILYSAQVVLGSGGDLIILSGTVFNHVLVWYMPLCCGDSVCENEIIQVRLAIAGHDGAIFGVRLSVDESCILSVSDDRTIRIWNLPSHWKTLLRSETLTSSLVLYGHTARVWDARMLPHHNIIVSVGEDATCRVWNYDGRCLSVIEGHKGRSVWSVAVDSEQQIVATGGGDCSIRTFNLHSLEETVYSFETLLPTKSMDIPRSVLLHKNTVISLTNDGYLYAASMDVIAVEHTLNCDSPNYKSSRIWTEVYFDPEYSGYCVASLSCEESGWLALGNLSGHIKLLKLTDRGEVIVVHEWEAHAGKVFSLNWTQDISRDGFDQLLFSCGPDGQLICWQVKLVNESFRVFRMVSFILPPSKHRWLSAVLVLCVHRDSVHGDVLPDCAAASPCSNHIVVCGDRKGSLHVFKCSLYDDEIEHVTDSLQSLQVHGSNGVTFITRHKGYVYSAGRDGYCRQYTVTMDDTLSQVRKFKPVKGMDWIEELIFTNDDLLVLGFQATNLVVYSTTQNKHIVCANCGGGHRSYGFSSQHTMISSRSASVVYIKQSMVHIKKFNLDSYFTKVVFQPPFTGREAISSVEINSDSETSLLAIGSEDCNIYIIVFHPQLPVPIQVKKTLQCHVSSVRALSCSKSFIDRKKHLLFSGGARASLKAWSLLLENNDDIIVSLETEKYLHEFDKKLKKFKKSKSSFDSDAAPECRVMSLACFSLASVVSANCNAQCHYVAVGCSDSQIRQYIYNEHDQKFVTQPSITFHKKCVLKVVHHLLYTHPLKHQETIASLKRPLHCTAVLCSSATDGMVALWDLQSTLSSWVQESNNKPDVVVSDLLHQEKSPQISSEEPAVLIQCHQSGVNDIAIYCTGYYDNEAKSYAINIATVGDDNAVVLSRVKMVPTVGQKSMHATMVHQCTQFRAHASSITGVQFIESNHLLTISIDQRVNLWIIDSSNSLIPASSYTHDVADVASLSTCCIRHHVYAVLCGIGIQCFCFQALQVLEESSVNT